MNTSQKKLVVDDVTRAAAHLSLIEIAIGSLIHAWRIPLGGHMLSLNQGAFLCQSSNESQTRLESSRRAVEISGIAAALKSLSPAGQKLGPMLSLSMQGALFAIGTLIGGRRLLGQMFGMAFLSLWAFAQPFITILISFGSNDLVAVFETYQKRMSPEFSFWGGLFIYGLAIVAGVKILVSLLVPVAIRLIGNEKLVALNAQLIAQAAKRSNPRKEERSAFVGAFRDLTRPLFLLSLGMMLIFWSIREPNWSRVVWLSLRPIGVAFAIFYLLRSPWFFASLNWLADRIGFLQRFRTRVQESYAYMNSIISKN